MRRVLFCLLIAVSCAGQTCAPTPPAPPDNGNTNGNTTEELIYTNTNVNTVSNGPSNPTTFTINADATVTRIRTYHWNGASGTPSAGTVSLSSSTGTSYGPWPCTGSAGQGGATNVYWDCYPNTPLPAGTYTVVDSDNATWSHNSASGNAGIVWVYGTTSTTPPTGGADAIAQAKRSTSIFFAFHGEHFYQRSDMNDPYPGIAIEVTTNHTTYLGTVSAPITWTGNTFRVDFSGTGTYNGGPALASIEATGTLASDGSSISSWEVSFEESLPDPGSTTSKRRHLKGSGQALPLYHTFADSVQYQALGSGVSSYLETIEDTYNGWGGFQSLYSYTDYAASTREPWLAIIFEE